MSEELMRDVLSGKVSVNSARAALGLPPIPGADEEQRQLIKTQMELDLDMRRLLSGVAALSGTCKKAY
jgi:hypothetical protein